jgi:putative flippase GtrA
MNIDKNNQVFIYIFNSGLTAAIYGILIYVSDSLFGWDYLYSVTLAYTLSMAFYFITNKKAVFKTKNSRKKTLYELGKFIVLLVINYFISILIVAIVHNYTKEVYSGSLLAGAVTITLTYFVFDKIIFKKDRIN